MNEKLRTSLLDSYDYYQRQQASAVIALIVLDMIKELSNTTMDFGADTVNFHTNNRADVEELMTLVKETPWTKSSWEGATAVCYSNLLRVVGKEIGLNIYAREDALPPTCTLEEVEVVIPAQEARVVKKQVVRCKQPLNTPSDESAVNQAAEIESTQNNPSL